MYPYKFVRGRAGVGVARARQAPVRGLDFLARGGRRDAERVVERSRTCGRAGISLYGGDARGAAVIGAAEIGDWGAEELERSERGDH